jgi:hypothetical protein
VKNYRMPRAIGLRSWLALPSRRQSAADFCSNIGEAGVHTQLVRRKKQTGRRSPGQLAPVIDPVREPAKVCDDSAIVGILNRLGYRTGTENTWNEK